MNKRQATAKPNSGSNPRNRKPRDVTNAKQQATAGGDSKVNVNISNGL